MSNRDSYRQGADDAQHYGKPNRTLYIDPYSSYAEGFDAYMKEHPMDEEDYAKTKKEE